MRNATQANSSSLLSLKSASPILREMVSLSGERKIRGGAGSLGGSLYHHSYASFAIGPPFFFSCAITCSASCCGVLRPVRTEDFMRGRDTGIIRLGACAGGRRNKISGVTRAGSVGQGRTAETQRSLKFSERRWSSPLYSLSSLGFYLFLGSHKLPVRAVTRPKEKLGIGSRRFEEIEGARKRKRPRIVGVSELLCCLSPREICLLPIPCLSCWHRGQGRALRLPGDGRGEQSLTLLPCLSVANRRTRSEDLCLIASNRIIGDPDLIAGKQIESRNRGAQEQRPRQVLSLVSREPAEPAEPSFCPGVVSRVLAGCLSVPGPWQKDRGKCPSESRSACVCGCREGQADVGRGPGLQDPCNFECQPTSSREKLFCVYSP
jgi:hypothetical protein